MAVELALQSGRVSAEHALNVLSRLKEQRHSTADVQTGLILAEPPQADVLRYDRLRITQESSHVQ